MFLEQLNMYFIAVLFLAVALGMFGSTFISAFDLELVCAAILSILGLVFAMLGKLTGEHRPKMKQPIVADDKPPSS